MFDEAQYNAATLGRPYAPPFFFALSWGSADDVPISYSNVETGCETSEVYVALIAPQSTQPRQSHRSSI